MKGFTLVEILIVVVIIAFLVALTLPAGINFYKIQQLDTITEEVVQALRRAQLKAMSVQDDSVFGVYFGSGKTGQYVLFRGNSYAGSNDKEIFDISDNVSFNGISEVVFLKLQGIPNITGDISLTLNGYTKTISINELGRVNLEL